MSKKKRFRWCLLIGVILSVLCYTSFLYAMSGPGGGMKGPSSDDPPDSPHGPGGDLGGEDPPQPPPPEPEKTIISGVPEYLWWYGCSPTSGGMLIGFWDAQPAYKNLWEGDISIYNDAAKNMIASQEHIDTGGWEGHDANCIADFMKTVGGGTWSSDIPVGLKDFVKWDNPDTSDVNESYDFKSWQNHVDYFGGDFTFNDFIEEIDKECPMLLNLMHPTLGGHSVTAYGYDPSNEFFAVWDTWGTDQISELDPADAFTDADGVEWWPWQEWTTNETDWAVFGGVYLKPSGVDAGIGGVDQGNAYLFIGPGNLTHTPEPKSFLLVGVGFLIVIGWHKKRMAKR